MTNYPVGDFLISVKNASLARKASISFPRSKLVEEVANTLKKLGYLEEIVKKDKDFTAKIVYKQDKPLILSLKLISKPGLRIYMGVAEVESKKGPSIFLLSTPRGIITSKEVKKLRVGGEVIAEIL